MARLSPPPPSGGWGIVFSDKSFLVFGAGAGKEFLVSKIRIVTQFANCTFLQYEDLIAEWPPLRTIICAQLRKHMYTVHCTVHLWEVNEANYFLVKCCLFKMSVFWKVMVFSQLKLLKPLLWLFFYYSFNSWGLYIYYVKPNLNGRGYIWHSELWTITT
jgi:hypothetical protein